MTLCCGMLGSACRGHTDKGEAARWAQKNSPQITLAERSQQSRYAGERTAGPMGRLLDSDKAPGGRVAASHDRRSEEKRAAGEFVPIVGAGPRAWRVSGRYGCEIQGARL